MIPSLVTLDESLAELRAAAGRVSALLNAAPDFGRHLVGSEWTAGDMVAHLIIALRAYAESLAGDTSRLEPFIPDVARFRDRLVAINRATIAAEPPRDAPTATADLAAAVDAYVAAASQLDAADRLQTPWYGPGSSLSIASATQLLLGEQVLHGRDLARTIGTPWPIEPRQSAMVLGAVRSMMPLVVNPDAVAGVTASFELRPRGSERFVVRIADGRADVDGATGQPVDCHLAGDPLALVLVGYGRISHWRAIAAGQLIAWGRKPWLAVRFPGYFFNP